MLKFGDIIDLKILDALEPTKQVIDMRDAFKHEEKEAVKKVYIIYLLMNDIWFLDRGS